MSALRSARENSERLFLRPPKGNLAFYPRDYVSSVASSVARQWSSTGPNAAKREVALALLLDPELRLRVCHLEDILKAKQLHARQQSATGSGSSTTTAGSQGHNNGECDAAQASQARGGSPPLPPLVQLQTALADPAFAALFELDPCITEPDWGMQVLWLNMTQLAKELGMAAPPSISPPPPSGAARSAHSSPSLPNGSTQPPTTVTVTPELAKVLSAVEAFFPEYGTDDDVYLAVAACYSLVTRRDPDGQLPPYTLHVSDLATTLRAFATADPRLAAVLQRTTAAPADGQKGGWRSSTGAALPLAPTGSASSGSMVARVGEVLCGPRGRGAFRVGDSPSRRGERAVSLMLEQLLRGLGSGGGASGRSPSGANSAPGVVLPGVPLGAWQQAAAASTSSNGASEASGGGGGGLPVFLYEYESPGDAAAARKLQEQQQQQLPQGNAGERPANVIGSRSASGGGAPGPAPQITLPLHHAWSDGPNAPRASADANATGTVPPSGASQMHPAASEPLLLSPSGNLASSVPSSLSHVHTFQRRSSEAVTNGRGGESDGGYASALAGLANLALGFGSAWTQSSPADSAFAVGSFGGTSGMRLPMFQRQSSSSVGPNGNGLNDPANQNQGDAAMAAAAAAMLGASPAGPGSELMHVPREIADVWANSGNAAAAAAMQQHQQQQHQQQQQQQQHQQQQHHQHQANMLAAAAAAMAAEAQQQLFAMSPPSTESGFPWNSRSHGGLGLGMGLDMSNVNRQASLGNPLTANGLQQAQLGLSLSGYMPQTASGTDANGMVVGSAPGGLHHTPHGFTTANGLATINGNTNMGYAAWPSSSPDVSMSTHALFSGRSAPSTDNGSNGPWLMTHGSLPGAAGGSPHVPPGPIASVVQGAAGAGLGGAVGGPQPPSLSEDSEEVSSGAGGLVDPLDVALSLEAIIGYEPTASGSELSASTAAANSTASSVSARRGLLPNADATAAASATVTGVSPPRGSIAAAVSHKPPLAANGLAAAGTKTFSSVAAALSPAGAGTKPQPNGTGTGSCTSSIDSSEALIHASRVPSACLGISSSDPQVLASPAGLPISSSAPNGAGAAVLSGWSALAARNAQHQQQQQQLQMHAAAAGSALVSPTGHHHRMGTTAQAVAAVQAAQAASLLAGAAAAAAGSKLMAQSLPSGGGVGMAVGLGLRDPFGGKVLHPRLTPRVRDEIAQLLRTVPGLKAEDFDDGVLHQLTLKKSEEEAVGALRMLAADNGCGLAGIQHMAAYINHVIKNYHHLGGPHGAVGPGGAGASLPSATVRANSTPVSSKAILQKLPLRVYKRLEEMIATCSYMEWKHFDAGVVKVMAQLAEIGEEDVFEELELLKSTDLSNVEYMPAYLNKRLNNRLWSRRKMLTSVAGAGL